jgi:excisionase family DNA binding protein
MEQGTRDKVPVNVAARIVGKSPQTVRRWIQEGKLDYERSSPRKTLIPRTELKIFRQEE